MIFTPHAGQSLMHDFMLNHERCNIFGSPGIGKSSASIYAYQTMRILGESQRALVFAPKRVALSSWAGEVEKFRETLGNVSVAIAVGTPDQRLAALRQRADITVTNYDNIDWLMDTVGSQWPWDTVFADEATRLKGLRIALMPGRVHKDGTVGEAFLRGQGASRAKRLSKIAHTKTRRWVNLTGSPIANGLNSAWPLNWWIDQGFRLGSSYSSFQQRWFHTELREGVLLERPNTYAEPEIKALMKPCSLTVDARDYFDIKEPIERTLMIDLPPKARQHYEEMQRQLFTEIRENPVEAFNSGVKIGKCLQIASGSIWIDRDKKHWEAVHDAKIDALKSLVEETNGEPLLISYQYVPDMQRILKAFPKFKTLDHKHAQKDFEEGYLPGLVVHPKSAGHGLSLQKHCRTLIDYSTGIDLELDEQVIERIGPTRQAQSGFKREVYRHRIVAKGTVEATVNIPRLKSKATLQDAFLNAMKISG